MACWLVLPLPRRQMPFARAMALGCPGGRVPPGVTAKHEATQCRYGVPIWAKPGWAIWDCATMRPARCSPPRSARWPSGWRAMPLWVHGCGFMDVCTPASGDRNRFAGGGHACMRRWRGCLAQRGSRLQAGTPQALGKPAFKGLDWRMRPQGQGAGKAHNCGNCPDKRGTGGNFPCICPLHLHPAATYVHVGPLDASQLPWLASFPNALPACPLCQHPEEAGAPLVPPYQGGWAAAGFACARGLPADAGSRFCAAAPARLPGTVFLCTGLGRLTICR